MPTTLLRGGRVYSPADPDATAMLIEGATVAWVGSEGAAEAYADTAGEVVHLDGALVTPAFVDAHVHATSTGLALTGLDLTRTASLAGALGELERQVRAARGRVVLGHGWDETRWPERRPPTRQELDRASYGGVVYLTRVDVHSAVASSALLAAAPGVRDAPGYEESGWLRGEAHHLARRVALGALTRTQRHEEQRAALARAASMGIGSIHELGGPEISSPEDFAAVLDLGRTDASPSVIGYWGELGGVERARELGALGAAGDLFADGALGSHTACLRAVYADAPHTGSCYLSAAQVRDHVLACTEAGLQAGFHAIGDGALEAVLAGFAEAAGRVGVAALRERRHRLEHVEMPGADMIATMARLGVFASVQPQFDALWGGTEGMYAQRLGVERALAMNPYADLAAAGVPLAFGSDSPVTPIDPWATVRAAVCHRTPSQRMSVPAAFAAHTVGGWRAAGRDDAGLLIPGAEATYAVWERAEGPRLPDLGPDAPLPRCLRTVVRGATVYPAAS